MRSFFSFILIVIAAMFFCSSELIAANTTVTDDDSGWVITLKSGDILSVCLKTNRAAGNTWVIDNYDDDLLSLTNTFYTPSYNPRPSYDGITTFMFTALNTSCTTDISIDYKGPNTQDIRDFSMTVRVKDRWEAGHDFEEP